MISDLGVWVSGCLVVWYVSERRIPSSHVRLSCGLPVAFLWPSVCSLNPELQSLPRNDVFAFGGMRGDGE